jgi:hypothetical protein
VTAKVARVEAELSIVIQPDPPVCSVLWLIPDGEGDLGETLSRINYSLGPLSCQGVLCELGTATSSRPLSELTGRQPVAEVRIEFPDTVSICQIAEIDVGRDAGFWELFSRSSYRRQLCAGLFRGGIPESKSWSAAAIQLAVIAGTVPFLKLRSSYDTRYALLQAFLAETLLCDGMAVTKVVPEMLGAGIGLTGAPAAIDDVEAVLVGAPRADEMAVKHSLQVANELGLGGPWVA